MSLLRSLSGASAAVHRSSAAALGKPKQLGQGVIVGGPGGGPGSFGFGFGGVGNPGVFGPVGVPGGGVPVAPGSPPNLQSSSTVFIPNDQWFYYRYGNGPTLQCAFEDPSDPNSDLICTPVRYPVTYGYNGWGV